MARGSVQVCTPFYADGISRRQGEIIPKSGANIGLLIRQGWVAELDSEDASDAAICKDKGCGRQFVTDDILAMHMREDHASMVEEPPVLAAATPTRSSRRAVAVPEAVEEE